jgi:ERCC4-type nuclease
MNEEIAAKYLANKNPQGYLIDGAPLRDITADEWQALPDQVRRSVAAADFYEVTPTGERTAEKTNLNELLVALPGINSEIAGALAAAGLDTPDKIRAAGDEELLAISGIKEKRLAQIRTALAETAPAGEEAGQEDGE